MTQAFVYVWKNKKTLRWYLGSHARKNCHPNNGYICSSKIVKPLIKQNPNDWERTVIAIGDPAEMLNLETELLEMLDAKNARRSFPRSKIKEKQQHVYCKKGCRYEESRMSALSQSRRC